MWCGEQQTIIVVERAPCVPWVKERVCWGLAGVLARFGAPLQAMLSFLVSELIGSASQQPTHHTSAPPTAAPTQHRWHAAAVTKLDHTPPGARHSMRNLQQLQTPQQPPVSRSIIPPAHRYTACYIHLLSFSHPRPTHYLLPSQYAAIVLPGATTCSEQHRLGYASHTCSFNTACCMCQRATHHKQPYTAAGEQQRPFVAEQSAQHLIAAAQVPPAPPTPPAADAR